MSNVQKYSCYNIRYRPIVRRPIVATVAIAAALSGTWVGAAIARGGEPKVVFVVDRDKPGRVVVELSGLDRDSVDRLKSADLDFDAWRRILRITLVSADTPVDSAIVGGYTVKKDVVRFTPRYPLAPGSSYRAVFHAEAIPGADRSDETPTVAVDYRVASRDPKPTPRVVAVYPSSDLVPENLLKLYVHFSAPMSQGRIYEHVKLFDDSGKRIDSPFLELGEELWNGDGTRLTLLFDPGRIKRGLRPREEDGPILVEGKTYTFIIDANTDDQYGEPIAAEFRKTFKAGPPDADQPDPARWIFKSPKFATREALAIDFPEPLDRSLLERCVRIEAGSRGVVAGLIEIPSGEKRWMFYPAEPWRRGEYTIRIEGKLEDLAGNSVDRPFEIDRAEPEDDSATAKTKTLKFIVK
jgi:hypothetical protein